MKLAELKAELAALVERADDELVAEMMASPDAGPMGHWLQTTALFPKDRSGYPDKGHQVRAALSIQYLVAPVEINYVAQA